MSAPTVAGLASMDVAAGSVVGTPFTGTPPTGTPLVADQSIEPVDRELVCLPLRARVRLSKNGRRSAGAVVAAGDVIAGM